MIDLRKGKSGLLNTVEVNGVRYSIYTNFRVWLEFGEKLKDKNSTLQDLCFVFKNEIPQENFLTELLEFYINENATPKKSDNSDREEILSYVLDGEYIYGSFMSQYKIDLIDIEYLHWWKFKALFLCLNDNAKIKQIMSMRGYEKNNKKTEQQYEELKEIWKLPNYEQDKESKRLLDEFNAL